MTEENIKILKKKLKNRLEMEVGLPLTPKLFKKVDMDFNDNVILVDNYPIVDISKITIDNDLISDKDCIIVENEGIIYLDKVYHGRLFVEYTCCIPEEDYGALLDLMVEYESDTNLYKDASSISEKNVSISFNTNLSKGALIQSMIQDLKDKYSCVVEMI